VSNRKQIHTKESITLEDILFPSTLEGKKLDKLENYSENSEIELNFAEQCELYIEKYLETKNPDYLFKAINSNPSILQGRSELKNSQYQSKNKTKKNQKIDSTTVVWESIYNWRYLGHLVKEKKISKIACDLLTKIGISLILKMENSVVYSTFGLSHVIPQYKSANAEFVIYMNDMEYFLEKWEELRLNIKKLNIKNLVKDIKETYKDKKNTTDDIRKQNLTLKLDNQLEILNTKFKKIIYPKLLELKSTDTNKFDYSTSNHLVASIVAHIHEELDCEFCKIKRTKNISPRTIYNKYLSVRKFLNSR